MSVQDLSRDNGSVSCRLMVGTSGYSYVEWVRAGFYPDRTKSGDMLPLYARSFSITELNDTWYQMPQAETVRRRQKQATADFLFAVKLTRTLTHEIDKDRWKETVGAFKKGVSPLLHTKQLAAVLIQLPPFFKRTPANRIYLAALLDGLQGLPLAVEFRHRSWAADSVFDELQRRRVTLTTVDVPGLSDLFPSLDVVTNSDLFYVRFHGRNAAGWRSGNMQHQFDYDYTDDELYQWVEEKIEPMAGRADKGILFFNNHVGGRAPKNAKALTAVLKERGFAVS